MERRQFLKLSTASALAASMPRAQAPAQVLGGAAMDAGFLTYGLRQGFIDNWLVAGPQNTPVAPAEYKFNADLRAPVVQQFFAPGSLITGAPREGASFEIGESTLAWKYLACQDDHLIDLSAWHPRSDYVRAWAFCVVDFDQPRRAQFELCTNGPAVCFLNGQSVLSHIEFDNFSIHRAPFESQVLGGSNTLLVRFDQLMTRNGPHTMALRLDDSQGVRVQIPTRTKDVARRQALEVAFESAYLSRDSYGDGQEVRLHVPALGKAQGAVNIELMSGRNAVRRAQWDTSKATPFVALGAASELKEGGYRVRLSGADNAREIEMEVARDAFSPAAYGTYEERRIEALTYAIAHGEGLRREVARMALGRWKEVDAGAIAKVIDGAAAWKDGADGEIMGLLGALIRYGDNPAFPADLKRKTRDVAVAFRYWTDEPGRTSMTYGSENHQLTFQTAEILAGQLFPNETFGNDKKTGAWHRAHGELLALGWLQTRMAMGFDEWDANGYLAADMAILSHLKLAEDPRLKDGATQTMHKILFGVALGSWKGSYGVAHARTQGQYIKDARHEPIACIARLSWGIGAWNHGVGSAAALACSDYRVPPVIEAIALDRPARMWARQQQGSPANTGSPGPASTATFKTPDFQLSCAQDYRAGKPGDNQQQHIWQATLSPEANVWVNHPACISENGNRRPNFWMGQATFPRVAQWQDALVAIHKMRTSDWLGWTHAYFPTFAFDEWKLAGDWAFARVGEGFLALRSQGGLEMVATGKSAYRELRSDGRENVWLCQMGRRVLDGDFAAFQAKVLAMPIAFEKLGVKWTTLRGQVLGFGWDDPLRIDGKEQATSGFPHYDNPYCQAAWPAEKIEIRHAGQSLVLDFVAKNKA